MSRAVIDQPGLRVIATGMVISLLIGLSLKSQITSDKIEKYLQRSVQVLQKDFKIDFDSAEVQLAQWGLPWPHLVIKNLRLSPKKLSCQNSQIFIDELEVPFQLSVLTSVKPQIETLRANHIEIRLAEIEDCFQPKRKTEISDTSVSSPTPTEHLADHVDDRAAEPVIVSENLFTQKTQSALKEISVEQIKVIGQKNSDQPFLLKQFHLYLDYDNGQLSQVDIKSRLFALKDNRTDIYFLTADLNSRLKPALNQQIELVLGFKGRVLDGYVQVFLNGSSLNQKISYEVIAKKVSLKALTALTADDKYDQIIDQWPLSISFNALGEIEFSKLFTHTSKFKNIEIDGDHVLIQASDLELHADHNKTLIEPFNIQFQQLALSPFKKLLTEKLDFQSVDQLGELRGELQFNQQQQWALDGFINGTELVFSHRGQREVQLIDSVHFNLQNKKKIYSLTMDQFKINSTEVAGGFEANYSEPENTLTAQLNVEGLLFNENVWKQLTQVSQSPVIKLNWTYKKSIEERHQAKLTTSEIQFPGLKLSDLQIDFLQLKAEQTKSIALSLKSPQGLVQVSDLKQNIVQALFNEQTDLLEPQYLALRTQFGLQGSDWKNMTFDFDSSLTKEKVSKAHLKAQGEWKSDQDFSATASLQIAQKTFRYSLMKTDQDEVFFTPQKKE